MKKIILSAVAVLAFGFTNAQNFKFGVKAGLNISTFTGDISDTSSKSGFAIGVFGEYKLTEKFALQPELLYSSLGAKNNMDNYDLATAYFNIPVLAKFYVSEKISLATGPQIGFLTSAKLKQGSISVDAKDTFNKSDFGFNFGAGYNFTKNISADVRYTLGLSNIAKDSGTDKVHNSNIAIALGYKF